MSNQKIAQSALLKAILVFISLGALILGMKMFHLLSDRLSTKNSENSLSSILLPHSLEVHGKAHDVYIPNKEGHKRAPIHFN